MLGINYLAVLVAAVVAFVMGGLWYSPLLFGKAWAKLRGIDSAEVAVPKCGRWRFSPSLFEVSLSPLCSRALWSI